MKSFTICQKIFEETIFSLNIRLQSDHISFLVIYNKSKNALENMKKTEYYNKVPYYN